MVFQRILIEFCAINISDSNMKTNFFRTVSIIYKNKFVNPYFAVFRHSMWALRKLFNIFPCDLKLGDQVVRIANRSIANGNGALINAMGYYDPNNMLLLKELFQKEIYNSFFDVGANIGVYSLIVAGQSKSIKVFAFEPHPQTFLLLRDNIRINNLSDQIICIPTALGDCNGTVRFADKAGDPENHILDEALDVGGLVVDVQRADKFCESEGADPLVLKIDVEGFENQVLSGFGKSLSEAKVIFVECWNLSETIKILCKQAGFMGPYKIDYKRRKFVSTNIHDEDWVFLDSQAAILICDILKFEISAD
jgi:FkbM family methyltransferase